MARRFEERARKNRDAYSVFSSRDRGSSSGACSVTGAVNSVILDKLKPKMVSAPAQEPPEEEKGEALSNENADDRDKDAAAAKPSDKEQDDVADLEEWLDDFLDN